MRVLVISSEFPPGPGGIATHAYQVSQNLAAIGWDVHVVSPQDFVTEQEVMRFNASAPFPVTRIVRWGGKLGDLVGRWRTIRKLVKMRKPDVLLATGKSSTWLGSVIARMYRLPWIVVGHGSEFARPAWWERRMIRWSFEQASGAVCVSEYTRGLMTSAGISPRRALVIHNGADETQFRVLPATELESFRQRINIPAEHFLLTVGHVKERKGQDTIINILPRLLRELPGTHYLMVGHPTKTREFSALARRLGVSQYVHFLGQAQGDDLVRYMNICDVFVLMSRQTEDGEREGFGIAAVEAALCMKPAVVSENSGLAEAVIHGETGLVVPGEDEETLSAAILTLLKDPESRFAMGKRALALAQREQTWKRRTEAYHHFLSTVIAEHDHDSATEAS